MRELSSSPAAPQRTTYVRWWILALVFLGTTLNYLDRMVMGILAPGLQKAIPDQRLQYGYIQSAFALSYAFGQVFSGRLLDLIGTRVGYALSLSAWSLAAMLHATVQQRLGLWLDARAFGYLGIARFSGRGQDRGGMVSQTGTGFCFRVRQRGNQHGRDRGLGDRSLAGRDLRLAMGIYWHGRGWICGAPALDSDLSDAARASVRFGRPNWRISIAIRPNRQANRDGFRWYHRQAWAFAIGKFLTDSMWWFYMTWFPKYLNKTYDLNLLQIGLPLVVIYIICDMGSIGGGWLSSSLIKRGVERQLGAQNGACSSAHWQSCRSSSPKKSAACGALSCCWAWSPPPIRDSAPTFTPW